jgi:phosphonate transport system substrate-binding protein
VYDHCTMTAGPSADADELARFTELLLGMSYADPEVRVLLDLEGLKQWERPRLEGYAQLEEAVDATGFYDASGGIGAGDYRP